jgi:hypothetical protein
MGNRFVHGQPSRVFPMRSVGQNDGFPPPLCDWVSARARLNYGPCCSKNDLGVLGCDPIFPIGAGRLRAEPAPMRVRTPTVAALPSMRIRIQSSSNQRILLSHVGIRGVPGDGQR